MSLVPVSLCVSNVLKELEQKHRFMWNFVLCFCFLFFLIASLNEATSLTIKKSIIKTPEGRALLSAVLIFYSQS